MFELDWLFVFGIFYAILLFVAYAKFASKTNPVFIIGIWYLFWCFISCTPLCGYVVEYNYGRIYVLSNIYIMLLLFVCFTRSFKYKQIQHEEIKVRFAYDTIHTFGTRICTILLVAIAIFVLYMLYTGKITLATWRTAVYAGESEGGLFSSVLSKLYFVFLKGYVIFDIILEIVNMLYKVRKLQVLPFINILIFALSTINRIEIVRVVLVFVLALAIYKRGIIKAILENKVVRKTLKVIAVAVIAVIALRYIANGATGGVLGTALQTVLKDFSLSFVTFDIFFEQYNDGVRLVDCNIFDILFGGIGQMFELVAKPLFGIEFENYNGILALRADYAIDIGKNQIMMANAFYTMYYNFVSGGGLISPYFVSGGFGILLACLYNKWKKSDSIRAFGIFVFIMHIVVMGVLRWEFYTHWAWVTLFLLFIFLKTKKLRAEEM